jgi:hypothetical protein
MNMLGARGILLMRPIISTSFVTAALVAGVTICGLATGASAATHHHRYQMDMMAYADSQPPLTVNKRSWLDPGPVVPVGSMEAYVTENTILSQTPDQNYDRSAFGNETLPRPFEVPGRQEPLATFWTPAYDF